MAHHGWLGGVEDINETIALDQEALTLRPPGHPDRLVSLNNLVVDLTIRHNRLGGMEDFNAVIVPGREALKLRPHGHPSRSGSLKNLTPCLRIQFSQLRTSCSVSMLTWNTSHKWCLQIICLDSPSKAWVNAAEDFHHTTTLLTYQTTCSTSRCSTLITSRSCCLQGSHIDARRGRILSLSS